MKFQLSMMKSVLAFVLACAAGVGVTGLSHLRKQKMSFTREEAMAKLFKRVHMNVHSRVRQGTVLFTEESRQEDGYDVVVQWDDDFDGILSPNRLLWIGKESFEQGITEE
jgi:hypothetical protein